MSFKVSEMSKKANGPRPLPKTGTQGARILHVIDLGVQEKAPYQGKPKPPARTVVINFELTNDKFEYNGEQVPHRISTKELTVSNDPKSAMFKVMNSLDPQGKMDGDLANYLNLPCLCTVVHNEVVKDSEKRTYANIAGLLPAPEGFPIPELHDKAVLFNFDEPTLEGYSELPKYIHDKMKKAVNYKGSKVEAIAAQYDAAQPAAEAEATPAKPAGKAPF